ncbi:F-type ATPase subunit delta [Actinomyces bovis]|uniref:ATP synthase subunit delta n=1 Tax=Actinomyces bovis TaxID=1658 RepID=A0ABY1VP05_9ACTO|nr:ATP synthase F1 subunit delta [Actinomyces bovis]SPT52798.1 F-type ATPase subunit delta [Actinomyces bovis]VEG54838.1 F-type ATPase subunit delta [Actinomyces israelii]
MNTGSAATQAQATQAWEPVLQQAGEQALELGEQILAVAHQIAANSLRGSLTDPGRSPQAKAALAQRLFAGCVDGRVVELLAALVRGRWSKPSDLVHALHDLGIQAILAGARAGGRLDAVEHEVFSVYNLLVGNRDLRLALEPSNHTTQDARVALAYKVLGTSLSSSAMSLVTWCVRHETEGGVPRNLRRVAELAAGLQNRTIADVTSAIPLSTEQEARLERILEQRLGTDVELNLIVDPEVFGGVRVRVRDLIIDSTVRSSLAGVRTQLVG